MRKNNIIFGVILVFIGLFILLNNLDIIRWSIIEVALDLWPLVLIAVGASIVFNKNRVASILIWVGFLVIIVAYGFYLQYSQYQLPANNNPDISYELESNIKTASLELDLSGVDLKIGSSNTDLLDGYIGNPRVDKKIDYTNGGERAKIVFKENVSRVNLVRNKGYNSNFYLSNNITWDIDGDIGAVDGDIDLRNLKVNNLDLDFGAGDINLLLGSNVDNLNIDLEAGATNIDIVVPEDLGVKVKLDGGLKQSNLKELNWNLVNDWYISPNYDAALSKASINVDMGVGNFELKVE